MLPEHHKHISGWLFIALLMSNHGIGMAYRIQENQPDYIHDVIKDWSDWALSVPTNPNYEREQDHFNTMSCAQLAERMAAVMLRADALMTTKCSESSCGFGGGEMYDVEAFATTAMRIVAISHVADEKLCLPEVQAAAHTFTFPANTYKERFLNSARTVDARDRFDRAFNKMAEVQEMIESLRGDVTDRRLIFPRNIEDPAVCPSPCQQCTTEHNSWHLEDEEFSFKCILNTGDPAPRGRGFECGEPVLRNSVIGMHLLPGSDPNARRSKTWCTVHDWQNLASETLFISAKLTCGAKAIFAPIQTGENMSEGLLATCESKEMGEAVTQADLDALIELDETIGNVVSPSNLAIFSLLMSVEITRAVGRLRQDTREPNQGNSHAAQSSAREGAYNVGFEGAIIGVSGNHNVRLAYNHTYREYSVLDVFGPCRRSLLSLTTQLFGGVVEVINGIAFLGVAAFFGFTFLLSQGSRYAMGRFLSYARRVFTNNVDATNALAGLEISPGDAGESLRRLERYAKVVGEWLKEGVWNGNLLTRGTFAFGVAFGFWGLSRIFHAFDSPYDCSAGQLGRGQNAVCHPSMMYGQRVNHPCPGPEGSEISFTCLYENKGVATYELPPSVFGVADRVDVRNDGCAFFAKR